MTATMTPAITPDRTSSQNELCITHLLPLRGIECGSCFIVPVGPLGRKARHARAGFPCGVPHRARLGKSPQNPSARISQTSRKWLPFLIPCIRRNTPHRRPGVASPVPRLSVPLISYCRQVIRLTPKPAFTALFPRPVGENVKGCGAENGSL